jgi:DNA replication and repair protein RecF
MHIRYLSLTNFRNYTRLELAIPERSVLLYGANAQGKTSLLEAIYLLATGASPLSSRYHQLVRWGAEAEGLPYTRVRAEIARRDRVQELEVVIELHALANGGARTQKTIRIDRIRKRQAELAGHLNVVVFMPQDVDLIAGSPSGRRRYLDDTLVQVDGAYAEALDQYTEALRQRNAILRHLRDEGGHPAQLAPFEEVLAREGVLIAQRRRQLLVALSQRADAIHQQLTGGGEWLHLIYQPNFDLDAPPRAEYQRSLGLRHYEQPPPIDTAALIEAFHEALVENRRAAIARGMTTIGPHRDDLAFVAGRPRQGTHEVDLGTYGSRGQQRTAVLTLKLAELAWMREQTGDTPVLLLDEVLAELDATRRQYLLERVNDVQQALLTATDPEMFSADFRRRATLWQVHGGIIDTQPDAAA